MNIPFSNIVKEARSAAALGFGKHPVAFAASAIAAPLFIKNDERGYAKSSLITTPLVGAFFAAAPRSFGMVAYRASERAARAGAFARKNAPVILQNAIDWYLKEGPTGLFRAYNDKDFRYEALKSFVDTGSFSNVFSAFTPETFGDIARAISPEDHKASADYVFDRLADLANDPSKSSLVTNAFEEARIRTASNGEAGLETVLNNFSQEQLSDMFFANYDNKDFMSRLSRNLRKAERITDRGPASIEAAAPTLPSFHPLNADVEAALEKQGRGMVLRELRKSGVLDNDKIISQAVLNGETGRVLGIQLKSGSSTLQIPILDPQTGTVHLGRSFERTGVARSVYDAENLWDLDVYLARHAGWDWSVLRKDLETAAYHTGVDPLSEYKLRGAIDSRSSLLAPDVLKMRSYGAVNSGLNVFSGGKRFSELGFNEHVDLLRALTSEDRGLRLNGDPLSRTTLTKVGSESSFSGGVLETSDASLFTVGGVPELSKQTPFFRDFAKELRLEAVAPDHRPWVSTDAATKMLGADYMPEIQFRAAGVDPQFKSLLGDLKDFNSQEDLSKVVSNMTTRMDMAGFSADQQQFVIKELAEAYKNNPDIIKTARKLGSLGETDFFVHDKYSGLRMKSTQMFHVDEAHLNVGDEFDPDTLIGFSDRQPVTSSGWRNRVREIKPGDGGGYNVVVDQLYPVETGAKISMGGVKGLTLMADSTAEFEDAKALVNIFRRARGDSPLAENIDVLAPSHYFNTKLADPFHLLMEQAAEVANLSADSEATSGFLDRMAESGFSVQPDGQIIEQMDVVRKLSAAERRARIAQITEFTEEYMNTMGGLVKAGRLEQAPLFKAFAGSTEASLTQYMQRNYLVGGARFWDTTRRNVPRNVSVTYDLLSEMYKMGHVEGIKDIYSRVDFLHGDPKRASALMDHILGGDMTRPLGKTISASAAESSQIAGQTGIFGEEFAENFSLDLGKEYPIQLGGETRKVRYVPMLGREAYKGSPNKYDFDQISRSELDKVKQALAHSNGSEALTAERLQSYFDTLVPEMFGKRGFYRAQAVDPEGLAGFLQNRPQENPFDMVISHDMLQRLKGTNPEVYSKLRRGEDAWATITRQPVSAALKMRVRYDSDSGLGKNMIGFDESIRGMLAADDDKDTIYMMFHRSEKAIEEAKAAHTEGSSQWQALRRNQFLFGSVEDSRNISAAMMEEKFREKSFHNLIAKSLKSTPADALANRLIGTKIPQYSNLLTSLSLNLENHPTLGGNTEAKQTLREMFWQIRQVPISGAKSQTGFEGDPMRLHDMIKRSLQGNASPELLIQSMQEVAEQAARESIVTPDTLHFARELGLENVEVGDRVNVFRRVLDTPKVQGWLREFAGNSQAIVDARSQSNALADLVSRNRLSSEDAVRLARRVGTASPEIQGVARGSMGATRSAEAIGAINDAIRSSAGKIAERIRPAKPILAVGLGLAAVAGLLTSTISNDEGIAPPSPSSSRYRPENHVGNSDSVPGDPVPGSAAPSRPKRTRVEGTTGPRRAVVAPMRQATNLEVTVPARDRDQTAEAQRVVQRMTSGNGYTSVTKNYSGSWMQTASKLRTRQKIADAMEQ